MKAAVFQQHGGPEVLRYEDVPEPKAGPNDVLIRVRGLWMQLQRHLGPAGPAGLEV